MGANTHSVTASLRPAHHNGCACAAPLASSECVSAALTGWVARRLGLGLSIAAALAALALGAVCLPLAGVVRPVEVPLIVLGQILSGVGLTISGSTQTSLRQAVTPERLCGRVNASYAFLTSGARPFGAILGGILEQRVGLSAILTGGALGIVVAAAWITASSIRAIRTVPLEVEPDPHSVSTDEEQIATFQEALAPIRHEP